MLLALAIVFLWTAGSGPAFERERERVRRFVDFPRARALPPPSSSP